MGRRWDGEKGDGDEKGMGWRGWGGGRDGEVEMGMSGNGVEKELNFISHT